MTTLEESICLMDWLRQHREIGLDCMTDDGTFEHLPEFCKEETQDYWEWERELRNSRTAGERNYALFAALPKKHGRRSTETTGLRARPSLEGPPSWSTSQLYGTESGASKSDPNDLRFRFLYKEKLHPIRRLQCCAIHRYGIQDVECHKKTMELNLQIG